MYCAYKNGNMQLNVSNLNIDDWDSREQGFMEYVSSVQDQGATFIDKGYERCGDNRQGTSYCFSLWVLDAENKPNILKQGSPPAFFSRLCLL